MSRVRAQPEIPDPLRRGGIAGGDRPDAGAGALAEGHAQKK